MNARCLASGLLLLASTSVARVRQVAKSPAIPWTCT